MVKCFFLMSVLTYNYFCINVFFFDLKRLFQSTGRSRYISIKFLSFISTPFYFFFFLKETLRKTQNEKKRTKTRFILINADQTETRLSLCKSNRLPLMWTAIARVSISNAIGSIANPTVTRPEFSDRCYQYWHSQDAP